MQVDYFHATLFISFQSHIQVLESAPANRGGLLMGLDYLIGISYVDDTEVFKVSQFILSLDKIFDAKSYIVRPFECLCRFAWTIGIY